MNLRFLATDITRSMKESLDSQWSISPERKRIVREGGWIAAGQLVSFAAILVGTRILTEFVPPGVFGRVSIIVGILALVTQTVCTPQLQAALRFYPEATHSGHAGHLRRIIGRRLMRSVSWLAIAIFVVSLITGLWTPFSLATTVVIILLFLLDVYSQLQTTLFSAARRQREFSLWRALERCLRPSFAILAVIVVGVSAGSVLLGYCLAVACVALVFQPALRTEREQTVHNPPDQESERNLVQRLNQFALPLAPLACIGWIISTGDRYILGALLGPNDVGIYATAYALVFHPATQPNAALNLILRPVLYQTMVEGDRERERRIYSVWLALSVAWGFTIVAFLFLFGDRLVEICLAQEYHQAVDLIPWLAVGLATQSIAATYYSRLFAAKKTKRIVTCQGVTAVASIIITLTFVHLYGLKGAAVACVFYFGLELVLARWLAR